MKKVLALVLAVIMVCTMAMAATVTGVTTATDTTLTAENPAYRVIVPGEAIVFTRSELKLDGSNAVLNKDNTFAPEKNKVEITFDKGSDLVASQGWVKVKEGTSVDYKYVIVTKANDAAILDDTADIIISKITVTKYGFDGSAVYSFAKKLADGTMTYTINTLGYLDGEVKDMAKSDSGLAKVALDKCPAGNGFVLVFNYGRHFDKDRTETKLTASATVAYDESDLVANTIGNTLYQIVKSDNVKEKVAYFETASMTGSYAYSELKIGAKVYFVSVPAYEINEKVEDELYNKTATIETVIATGAVVPNGTNVEISVDEAKEGYTLYMINADGSLKNLNAKIDDNGVLRATAKVTGPVVLSDKALTAATTTTPGSTTNPGTGANDVVGVAAALAVVALVSGAAISLKK